MNQFENSNSAMYDQYQSSADMMMSGALVTLLKGDQITSQSDIMTDITLGAGGDDTLQVAEGGQVIYTTVNAGGNIFLSSGGIASGTNISSGGGLHVNSGASAWETTVKQGGFFGVGLGAVTYITTIDSAGSLTVLGRRRCKS